MNLHRQFRSCVALAGIVTLFAVPTSICVAFFVATPLAIPAPEWATIATLNDIEKGGVPLACQVTRPQHDAWQTLPPERLPPVYVVQINGEIAVLSSRYHPQFQVPVVYDSTRGVFKTTCWDLEFTPDGRRIDETLWPYDMLQIPYRVNGGQIEILGDPRGRGR